MIKRLILIALITYFGASQIVDLVTVSATASGTFAELSSDFYANAIDKQGLTKFTADTDTPGLVIQIDLASSQSMQSLYM